MKRDDEGPRTTWRIYAKPSNRELTYEGEPGPLGMSHEDYLKKRGYVLIKEFYINPAFIELRTPEGWIGTYTPLRDLAEDMAELFWLGYDCDRIEADD